MIMKSAAALGWPGSSVMRRQEGLGWPAEGSDKMKSTSIKSSVVSAASDVVDAAGRQGVPEQRSEADPRSATCPSHAHDRSDTLPAHSIVVQPGAPRAQGDSAVIPASPFGPLPRPPATRVVAIANQKGGVGKTTSAVNLAAALAMRGARVLLIDLDPQGNASTALGVDHSVGVPSVYDVLIGGKALADVVNAVPEISGLYAAPATIDLAGAEIELVSLVARETRLHRALTAYLHDASTAPAYDYVFIDCPPSLGLLTLNALVAAREICIPIQCEYYALEGLGQLLRNVEMIQSHLNPALSVSSILLTMYDGRTRLASQVADEVRSHFQQAVLPTAIPRSVRVSEAPSYGQTVLTYDPASSGAWCYLQAAEEFAERMPATETVTKERL